MTNVTTNATAKFAALVAGFGLVAMSIAPIAQADTASDAAMIASLQAQLAALTAKSTTTTTTTGTATFNYDLTMGSKGASVTALQNWLISKGFAISAGATGYFGAQTKAALAAWQAANGVSPAVGYFGPITRAKVNAMAGGSTTTTTTSTVPGCVAGAMFSSTTGAACGSTTTTTTTGSTAGITTIGAEGNINVEKESSNVMTTIYEGEMKDKILGVRIEAKDSDVNFSRVRVNLGTTTDAYNKIFTRVYLLDDAGNTLTSRDLNSSSVTRVDGTVPTYYVNLSGFNYVIKKDMKKSFYVAFDVAGSISSEYRGSRSISFYGEDAIRVTDGAGIDQYSAGANAISQTFSISQNLSDAATFTVSTDPSVRKATTIVADQGANNNETDKAEVGSFRVLPEKDGALLRNLVVEVTSNNAGPGTLQTLYLYDGSSQVATASGVASTTSTTTQVYTFSSINVSIARDVYKTYTLKADFRSVGSPETFQVGSVKATSVESLGTARTITASNLTAGAGEVMTTVSKGVVAGIDSKSIDIVTSRDQNGTTTEAHLSAVFNLSLQAVGADSVFGTAASAFSFSLLKNGSVVSTSVATTTAFYPSTQPTGTTNYSASGFTLPRNATVSIPVTFKVDANSTAAVGTDLAPATYAVRLNSITYTAGGVSVTNSYTTNSNYVTSDKLRP